jgi:hypothetical protein
MQLSSRTQSLGNPRIKFADHRARVIEVQGSLYLLLELNEHLPHDIFLEGLSERTSKHGLSSGKHHNPERGKLPSHLSMTGSTKPHSLRQGAPL